ncbi:MAG: OmpH family outer membrane protein [Gammaproteobacteria bacterium]|nr:OmpH family outer membrane protein [Gammaproteobacteria bacterium]
MAVAVAVTVVAVLPAPAHAQSMGYVDARRLINDSPQGKQQIRELEAEFAERNRELKVRLELFKEQEDELEKNRLALSEAELLERAADLREQERKLRRAQREYNEDHARRRSHHLGKLEKLITEVIGDVAKRENLDMVLQRANLVYASEKIDLTDAVMKELEARHTP